MSPSGTRDNTNSLKAIAECFGNIGWDKKLCELKEEQVLGIIAKIQSMREITDEYTEQGALEFQQSVSSPRKHYEFDDEIPF